MRKLFFALALVPFLFAFSEGELDNPKAMCKQCEQKIKAAKTEAELDKAGKACAEPLKKWVKENPKIVKAKKEELGTMVESVIKTYKSKKKELKKKK